MTQRKEMFHNASTGGKPGDNGANGRLKADGPVSLCARAPSFLARGPVSPLPPLHLHQVWGQPFPLPSPDPPNFIRPQPEAPLQVLPHTPLTTFGFRILSSFLSCQSSRWPAGKHKHKSLACLSLGELQWEGLAQGSTGASHLLRQSPGAPPR